MDRDEACRIIFDFLRLEHPLEEADAIFAVGGSSPSPALMAGNLYQDGWAPKLAFIDKGGTFGPKGDVPTAVHYRGTLLVLGIAETDMLWAPLTGNTLEEARVAIPFLLEHGVNPKTVLLVARPIHQRRAWATFQRQWPRTKFVSCPADEPFDPEETSRLVEELNRLELYGSAGDLIPQEIPDAVQEARELLANAL